MPSPTGTTFTYSNRTYEVTGYVPSRYKFPYTVKRLPDGKLFKMPANIVEGTPVARPTTSVATVPKVGTRFTHKGSDYEVTGYNASRPKFPVEARRLRDGAPFKFTPEAVTAGNSTLTVSSTKQAPTMTIKVGDWVEFDINRRGKPPVIAGFVSKINATTVSLSQTTDGHPVGWRMSPSSLRPSTMPKPAPKATVPPVTVRVGQTVTFTAATWASNFQLTTITGVVTLTDTSKGEVEVYASALPMGSRRFPANEVKPALNREDKAIVKEVGCVYASLSPENLTCDGERPRAQVATVYASLQRALRALQAEAGRTISEDETYRVTA